MRQPKWVTWAGRALALVVVAVIAVLVFDLEHAAISHGYNGKCLVASVGVLAMLAGYVLRLVLEPAQERKTTNESEEHRNGDRPGNAR